MTDAESIRTYYDTGKEHNRLTQGLGHLEFERTKQILTEHLPLSPAVVHAVGGGTGRYAAWLTGLGHEVHHSDLVPLHVEQAAECFDLTSTRVCDARSLPYESRSSDCVLLLGPLYHLCSPEDRQTVLSEARRILKPGGLLFAAAISRYASTTVGIHRRWIWDVDYWAECQLEIETGRHEPPSSVPESFSVAYFHHPDSLSQEVEHAGFSVRSVLGIEGTAWLTPDFDADVTIPERRDHLIEVARKQESDPVLGPHMLAIATS